MTVCYLNIVSFKRKWGGGWWGWGCKDEGVNITRKRTAANMSEIQIHTIPILPFGMVNAFLLTFAGGAVLVDTGLPGSETKIEKVLANVGLCLADLKLIVVTHGHIDHAGSAKRLQKLSGAPIVLHEGDLPYCRGQAPILKPSGLFGRLFKLSGAIERPFAKVEPVERTFTREKGECICNYLDQKMAN